MARSANNRKLTVQRHSSSLHFILMVVAFLAFYVPANYAVSERIYTYWQYLKAIVSVIAVVLFLARSRITLRWLSFVSCFASYYLLATLLYNTNGSLTSAIYNCMCGIGFVSLLEYCLSTYKDECLKAFIFAGIIMCSIHMYTSWQYKDVHGGMRGAVLFKGSLVTTDNWFFLTGDNMSIFYFLPLLCVLWYYAFEVDQRYLWLSALYSALTLSMYISTWAVTAMVVVAFLTGGAILLLLQRTNTSLGLFFSQYRVACLLGLMVCLVVVLGVSSDFLSYLARLFAKSIDAARGIMWKQSLLVIKDNWLIGIGIESTENSLLRLFVRDHCHNLLLQLMYCGGLVSTLSYLFGIFRCKSQDRIADRGNAIIGIGILCYFTASTFDWYLYRVTPLMIFYIAAFSSQIKQAVQNQP